LPTKLYSLIETDNVEPPQRCLREFPTKIYSLIKINNIARN